MFLRKVILNFDRVKAKVIDLINVSKQIELCAITAAGRRTTLAMENLTSQILIPFCARTWFTPLLD
jgi:hypothetical protein